MIISSPEPLGSQGELIVYPSSRRPSVGGVCRRSQCSKIFFFETAGPLKAKFYVEPPWVGGTIFCSRHLGHMTKMAATPIYGKNPSKIFYSRTGMPIFTKLGMYHGDTVDFSETIEACDLKVGRYRQLNDFMKVCEY